LPSLQGRDHTECMFNRMKQPHGIATRYNKTKNPSYAAFLAVVSVDRSSTGSNWIRCGSGRSLDTGSSESPQHEGSRPAKAKSLL